MDEEELGWAIENDVTFFVSDPDCFEAAKEKSRRIGKPARIHVEIETGLHRTGLEEEALDSVLSFAGERPDLVRAEGICTHLAGAESSANYLRISEQLARYGSLCTRAQRHLDGGPKRHVACSAAALTYPETILDMVRIGIAQYGYWPSEETRIRYVLEHESKEGRRLRDPLRRVIRWVSRIAGVKRVAEGDFVGYGNSYLATRPMTVASVPIGYYHGFPRNLSNLGHVLVHGRRAAVVGRVNMHLMMVDVTECSPVHVGDEVVVVGKQGRAQITFQSFTALTRNVNYEALVRIPVSIPRVVVE
jgi:alanine racemase